MSNLTINLGYQPCESCRGSGNTGSRKYPETCMVCEGRGLIDHGFVDVADLPPHVAIAVLCDLVAELRGRVINIT